MNLAGLWSSVTRGPAFWVVAAGSGRTSRSRRRQGRPRLSGQRSVACLRLLIEGDKEEGRIHDGRAESRKILEAARQTDDPILLRPSTKS